MNAPHANPDDGGHPRHHNHGNHNHDHRGHHQAGEDGSRARWWHRLRHQVGPHSHDPVDTALETSRDGLRALWISLIGLAATAGLQAVAVAWSGSACASASAPHWSRGQAW